MGDVVFFSVAHRDDFDLFATGGDYGLEPDISPQGID